MISLFVLFSASVWSQEICDNAIDDDADGLIDINDPDCECTNLIDLSLIPNPSFEDTVCCPAAESMLNCATEWVQASGATSDFYHSCGVAIPDFDGAIPPAMPLPGAGEGYIGLYNFLTGYREYAGACTTGPLLAGVSYSLNLHSAYAFGGEDEVDLELYGSPLCSDLPWLGVGCPEGVGSWELLGAAHIVHALDGAWENTTIEFVPAVDLNAIAFGATCGDIGETDGSYFYYDELVLLKTETLGYIEETGGWCSGDIVLTAVTDDPGGTWQWYKEGVALPGETGANLSPVPYGAGTFTARYTYPGGCKDIDYTSPFIPTASFEVEAVCFGEQVTFENTSDLGGAPLENWLWSFGDGVTSAERDPSHLYAAAGAYTVELIAFSEDESCNDTASASLTVFAKPIPTYAVDGVGVSSTGETWLACAHHSLMFTDLTTIDGPVSFASWNWDFGSGDFSTEQNPVYAFTEPGTYDVELLVVSENGCSDSVTVQVIVNELVANFVALDSVCEGTAVVFTNISYATDGSPIASWRWTFEGSEDTLYIENPTYLYGDGGIFETQLYVDNFQGCQDSLSRNIVVHPKPEPNFYANLNPTDYFNTDLKLVLIYPNGMSDYYWEMPGGLPSSSSYKGSVDVKYPEFISGDYPVTLTETTEFGCIDSVMHVIQVLEDEMVFAPNSFTPNGDPFNPDWGVYVEGFLDNEFYLSVFNRWGEIIWETTDPTDRWDGTYVNGLIVPTGTYVWYIKARDQINDEIFEYTGTITVLK